MLGPVTDQRLAYRPDHGLIISKSWGRKTGAINSDVGRLEAAREVLQMVLVDTTFNQNYRAIPLSFLSMICTKTTS